MWDQTEAGRGEMVIKSKGGRASKGGGGGGAHQGFPWPRKQVGAQRGVRGSDGFLEEAAEQTDCDVSRGGGANRVTPIWLKRGAEGPEGQRPGARGDEEEQECAGWSLREKEEVHEGRRPVTEM